MMSAPTTHPLALATFVADAAAVYVAAAAGQLSESVADSRVDYLRRVAFVGHASDTTAVQSAAWARFRTGELTSGQAYELSIAAVRKLIRQERHAIDAAKRAAAAIVAATETITK
jgi:hypothetical protein